jgi:hypothetical protein
MEAAMAKQISFTRLEKEYISRLRNRINIAEDKVDLDNHFSHTLVNLLNEIFGGKDLKIAIDDVAFMPESKSHYWINDSLLNSEVFRETWGNSNLPHVIRKFADSAHRRYLHLNKHTEKTTKKIRN